jgi:hypothetical protein
LVLLLIVSPSDPNVGSLDGSVRPLDREGATSWVAPSLSFRR